MPPVDKTVTVVRPDGSTLRTTASEAEKLKLLGYRAEEAAETVDRVGAQATEEFYSTGSQQFATGVEGLMRGASLGGSDYLFGDSETGARAKANPGVATATEIIGAVGSEFIPGLNLVAPAAAVGRGARAIVGGAGIARGAVRGVIEGAVVGGAMSADHAYLAGDPITAEAVAHGMKMGALFGMGMGGVAGGLSARGARGVARGLEDEAAGVAAAKAGGGADDLAVREAALSKEYAAIRQAETRARAAGQFEAVPGTYAKVSEHPFSALKAETSAAGRQIKSAIDTVEAVFSGNKKAMAEAGFTSASDIGALAQGRRVIDSAFRKFSKSLKADNFTEAKLTSAFDKYKETVAQFANRAGVGKGSSSHEALMNYAEMKLVQKQLAKMPHTSEGFARMGAEKAEQLFAALDKAKKLGNFPAMSATLDDAASKFQEALGLQATGTGGLRSTWKQAQAMWKAEKTAPKFTNFKQQKADLAVRQADLAAERAARPAVEGSLKPEPGFGRKVLAYGAGAAAYKGVAMTGHPFAAIGVAAKVRNKILNWGAQTPELVAARQQTLGRIKQAVGRAQMRLGAVVAPMARMSGSLGTFIDGRPDTSTKDPKELAYNRLQEFARVSTHVKDTAYRTAQQIAIEQPELAPAIYKYMVDSFQALRGMMPADPGVVSGLKSIFRPSALQAMVMDKQISVWQDPVGVAEEMLSTGIYDPIRVKAMKEISPAIYRYLQAEFVGRLDEPGFLDGMNYREQVSLGALLGIPINSSMKPEYIAASQQLHTQRNQPLPSPAIPGSTNGGRPAADTPGATAAQISTAR